MRARLQGGGVLLPLLAAVLLASPAAVAAEDSYAAARAAMVRTIQSTAAQARDAAHPIDIGPGVVEVMGRVPRHLFVPEDLRGEAYDDRPLPIGFGQTVSQPFIVALMTELLQVQPGDSVLEIGTGSGYQAAVLAELAARVYTIEVVPELAAAARERLAGISDRVEVRQGDGYYGWPEHAPFDAIIVTAAASHIPPPLVQQLNPGGRLLVPVGPPFLLQHLTVVEKRANGGIHTQAVLPVTFVPLVGGVAAR